MDELLKRVAELKGMPASLVERSAQARAEKLGVTLEEVLKDWAGESTDSADSGDAAPDEPSETSETSTDPAAEETSDSPPDEITTDYLVGLAAETKRMPPKLILSSATARAEHAGTTLDEVLALWAGVDLEELREAGPAAPPETEAPAKAAPATTESSDESAPADEPATAAAGAGTITMDDLLAKVAESKGMPAVLMKRSADAKAKEAGKPLEEILAEWAGIDVATVITASAPPAEPATAAPEPAARQDTESSSDQDEAPEVEVIEASPATSEAAEVDESEDSVRPLTTSRYPRWLAAAFVLIPLFGVIYILGAPNGPDCGTAGQLYVDPESGLAVSCDGSSYPSFAVDFFADGERIYAQCTACHAVNGTGGVGPSFAGGAILAIFPDGSCGDHIEWVALGTAQWPDSTYGATNKSVGGGGNMPPFGAQLSEEELASVVLYERVAFGGQVLEEAEIDCGLVEDPDGPSVEAAGS